MPTEVKITLTKYAIIGIDFRDLNDPWVGYDNGNSDHPSNWTTNPKFGIEYSDYQTAWNRLQQLYKAARSNGDTGLIGITFMLRARDKSYTEVQYSDEERLAEILAKFNNQ